MASLLLLVLLACGGQATRSSHPAGQETSPPPLRTKDDLLDLSQTQVRAREQEVIGLLKAPDPKVRQYAAATLARADDASVIPALLDALDSEKNATVQDWVLGAIAHYSDPRGVNGVVLFWIQGKPDPSNSDDFLSAMAGMDPTMVRSALAKYSSIDPKRAAMVQVAPH